MKKNLQNTLGKLPRFKTLISISTVPIASLALIAACDLNGPSLAINSKDYCTHLMANSQNSSIQKYRKCIESERDFKKLVYQAYEEKEGHINWIVVRGYIFDLKSPSYREAYGFITRDADKDNTEL